MPTNCSAHLVWVALATWEGIRLSVRASYPGKPPSLRTSRSRREWTCSSVRKHSTCLTTRTSSSQGRAERPTCVATQVASAKPVEPLTRAICSSGWNSAS